MENNDLKEYVQCIQNKISIAAAIAVIRSKPSHLTASQYAEIIQEKTLQAWMNKKERGVFSDKILELEQDKVLQNIANLLNPTQLEEDEDSSQSEDEQFDFCSEIQWADSFDYYSFLSDSGSDCEFDTPSPLDKNIKFIESMIQLKFAVESGDAQPVYSYLGGSVKQQVYQAENPSEDSGFGDANSTRNSTIQPSLFRFISHSYKTDGLIRKCTESLLDFLWKHLSTQPPISYKGSMLENLSNVLQKASVNPVTSETISTFVVRYLQDIWLSQQTSLLYAWEYQMKTVFIVCCNKYTCEPVIECIITKLKDLSSLLTTLGPIDTPQGLAAIHFIEKAPLFIALLLDLIRKWRSCNEKDKSVQQPRAISYDITQLWKEKWKETSSQVQQESKDTQGSIMEEVKSVCESLIVQSSLRFPLLAYHLSQISSSFDSSI